MSRFAPAASGVSIVALRSAIPLSENLSRWTSPLRLLMLVVTLRQTWRPIAVANRFVLRVLTTAMAVLANDFPNRTKNASSNAHFAYLLHTDYYLIRAKAETAAQFFYSLSA
jgi:hypothetical protein